MRETVWETYPDAYHYDTGSGVLLFARPYHRRGSYLYTRIARRYPNMRVSYKTTPKHLLKEIRVLPRDMQPR